MVKEILVLGVKELALITVIPTATIKSHKVTQAERDPNDNTYSFVTAQKSGILSNPLKRPRCVGVNKNINPCKD